MSDPVGGREAERNPANTIAECRHPGLPCDRVCLECRGDFDVVDRKTGRRVGDVSDAVAMARLLAEFGEPEREGFDEHGRGAPS